MKFSELQRLQRREGITVLSADERIEQLEARLRTVTKERDAMRARITQMEKQAPVRWGCTVLQVDRSWKEEIGIEEPPKDYFSIRNAFPLYALPGAKGEEKMKLSEKIQEALREQQEINLSDPAVQRRLAAQWGYVPAGEQVAPVVKDERAAFREWFEGEQGVAVAYDGLWSFAKAAWLARAALGAPSVPDATWLAVPDKHPTFDPVDLRLADGSVLCGCVPQSDGDYWWEGPGGEVFIDPRYAPVTHWRLSAAPEAKP